MAAMHEQDFRIERFDCRNFMLYINFPLVLCCMHCYFQCDVNVQKIAMVMSKFQTLLLINLELIKYFPLKDTPSVSNYKMF
jgi:hypothetical protein